MSWTPEQLDRIDEAEEVLIAARRADGTARPPVPIWVVRVDDQVYVRTWQRRDTGWFGAVLRSGRARISAPGLEADVAVDDVGADDRRAPTDDAYRAKYGRFGDATIGRMVTGDAVAATLRLTPLADRS